MSDNNLKHKCKENNYIDAEISYRKINREQWSWVLEQWQIPTQDDFDCGYTGAAEVPMCSHDLLISHCPFCGEVLVNIKANT